MSERFEGGCRHLPALHHHFVGDLLPLIQPTQPSVLHSGDVDKHILAAIVGLDESEPFLHVLNHLTVLSP